MLETAISSYEDDASDAPTRAFFQRLARWMEFLDAAGQLRSYSESECLELYLQAHAHDRNKALQALKMRAFFATIAELIELETGSAIAVRLDRHDDSWRVILHGESLVVLDLRYHGAQPLHFASLTGLGQAAEHLLTRGIGRWFSKSRSRVRAQRQLH